MADEKRSRSFSSRLRRTLAKAHESSEDEKPAKRSLSFRRKPKQSTAGARVESSSASVPNLSDFKDLIDDDDPDEAEGKELPFSAKKLGQKTRH